MTRVVFVCWIKTKRDVPLDNVTIDMDEVCLSRYGRLLATRDGFQSVLVIVVDAFVCVCVHMGARCERVPEDTVLSDLSIVRVPRQAWVSRPKRTADPGQLPASPYSPCLELIAVSCANGAGSFGEDLPFSLWPSLAAAHGEPPQWGSRRLWMTAAPPKLLRRSSYWVTSSKS